MTLCYYCCFNAVENKQKIPHYRIVGNTVGSCESEQPKTGRGEKSETNLFHTISIQSPRRVFWGWGPGGRSGSSMKKENVPYYCHIPLHKSSVIVWVLYANSNRNGREKQILDVSGQVIPMKSNLTFHVGIYFVQSFQGTHW